MSAVLETEVLGDPGSCTTAAGRVDDVRAALGVAEREADTALRLCSSWQGRSGVAFEARVHETAGDLAHLGARLETLRAALLDFAGELTVVEDQMGRARSVAAAGGVAVQGTRVLAPTPPQAASQGEADAHERRVRAWNEAVGIADGARTKEAEAHQHLADGLARSAGDGFLQDLLERLGLLPPDYADGDDIGAWLLGLGGLGFGSGVGYLVNGRYGRFQPRVNGRFGSPVGMTFWERLRAAGRADSWHATPYGAATRNAWTTAGRWAGRAGTAVTALSSGWNQWQADADDPSMSTTERTTRAVTMGGTTAAGAWAGAQGGAWAGGAIGTAICPGVGTVIGGAVGGLVGGAIGGFAGGELGEAILDPVGDAADAVGDFVGDAAGSLGDAAGDVGDALTFWD